MYVSAKWLEGLSVRTRNCLDGVMFDDEYLVAGLRFRSKKGLREVLVKNPAALLRIPNFGQGSLLELYNWFGIPKPSNRPSPQMLKAAFTVLRNAGYRVTMSVLVEKEYEEVK